MLYVFYVFTSMGLYLLKIASNWTTLTFFSGGMLYGLGALQWIIILRSTPLSISFPIAAGALMIGTVLTGMFFLKEAVSFWHIFGTILIFSGIVLITCFQTKV